MDAFFKHLSLARHQAIIWISAEILLIGHLRTNFSEILIEIFIQENAFENVVWKIATILYRPQYVNKFRGIS